MCIHVCMPAPMHPWRHTRMSRIRNAACTHARTHPSTRTYQSHYNNYHYHYYHYHLSLYIYICTRLYLSLSLYIYIYIHTYVIDVCILYMSYMYAYYNETSWMQSFRRPRRSSELPHRTHRRRKDLIYLHIYIYICIHTYIYIYI